MSWNYRVIHTTEALGLDDGAEEDVYRIVEMFYEDDTDDKPNGWGEASAQGESLGELRGTLEMMIRALEKPVIEVCAHCKNTAPGHRPDCKRPKGAEMEDPFQIGCGECGFKADTPEQYIDHVLVTEHAPKELLAQLREGSGYADFARELQMIQEHGARGQMPPDARRVSLDEVPDDVREQFEKVERREMEDYAAKLTTPEVIARLRIVGDMMERMASVRPPSESGSEIILSIRAAEIRLRELVTAELRIVETFMALVNERAENDIAKDGPIEGAHHRAMQAVRKEWPNRPPFPPEST